jgi:phenylalanyl-tRNA synthetase beta chain
MELSRGQLRGKELTPDFTPRVMKISLENTNKLLGTDISEKELKEFLERMGYNYKNKLAEIPAWRTDILHEVDLIEDVAIAYGYENLVPEIPEISTTGEESGKEKIKRGIANILAGLSFLEASSYHLTNKKAQLENMNLPEKEKVIEVEQSKTEYNVLRKNLTHSLLKILSENVDSEYPQKIFEIGKIFNMVSEKIVEKESLSLAIAPGNFTEVRQAIEYLFRMLEINVSFSEPKNMLPWFIDGRTAEISLNGKSLGFIGEIHPKILKNWKIKMPVALFEIDLDEVFKKLLG